MEKPFVALKDPIQSGTGPDEAQELWAVTPDPGDGTGKPYGNTLMYPFT